MKFNEVADIFEVAVRIERHSVEFYVNLFRTVESSRARETFSILAAEEEKHLGRFRVLLENAVKYVPRYCYPGEYELFVDGMAARVLESFHDHAKPMTAATAVEAIRIGMELERGAIAFYRGLVDQFSSVDRVRVEELIAEEVGHLERLAKLMKTYPEGRAEGFAEAGG